MGMQKMQMQKAQWVGGAIALVLAMGASPAWARKPAEAPVVPFKKVMIVILENQNSKQALKQPFMQSLTERGTYFANYYAIRHPSQPNYIALVSGDTHRVTDDGMHTVIAQHIGDLLDQHGLDWKNYAENYPVNPDGGCFLGSYAPGNYVRKHMPFLSFNNIQVDKPRCARHIVPAEEMDKDIAAGTLPAFGLYIPNDDNNGHDKGVVFADNWLKKRFGPLLDDPRFMQDMLFVVTFDEDNGGEKNRVYTVFVGAGIESGKKIETRYDHYSLLRTIEDAFGLGTLGAKDMDAKPIEGAWTNR